MDNKIMHDLEAVNVSLRELIDAFLTASEKAAAHIKLVQERKINKETYLLVIAASAPEFMTAMSKVVIGMNSIKVMADNMDNPRRKEPARIIPGSFNKN